MLGIIGISKAVEHRHGDPILRHGLFSDIFLSISIYLELRQVPQVGAKSMFSYKMLCCVAWGESSLMETELV